MTTQAPSVEKKVRLGSGTIRPPWALRGPAAARPASLRADPEGSWWPGFLAKSALTSQDTKPSASKGPAGPVPSAGFTIFLEPLGRVMPETEPEKENSWVT